MWPQEQRDALAWHIWKTSRTERCARREMGEFDREKSHMLRISSLNFLSLDITKSFLVRKRLVHMWQCLLKSMVYSLRRESER